MLQVVAGLTVVFVGYVLYEVFKTVSSQSSSESQVKTPPPAAVTAKPAVSEPAVAAAAKPQPTSTAALKPEPQMKKVQSEPKKSEAAPDEVRGLQLKDPVSGETGPAPTNYRFAKKWVKEALVAEGLLDKVYKTADLDDAGSQKVREALEKFKAIEKYHG
ncbi:MAG: hypothetical protein MUF20_03445 [Methylotetracoccus sp.]|jgi:hypothetical protein|nr:hypothetical protein [Methylotetracoccus sp.]